MPLVGTLNLLFTSIYILVQDVSKAICHLNISLNDTIDLSAQPARVSNCSTKGPDGGAAPRQHEQQRNLGVCSVAAGKIAVGESARN